MSTGANEDSGLNQWYNERIGETSTADEATGYWIFVVGLIVAAVGILMFLPSSPRGSLRQWSFALLAVGLTLLIAGPLIRLPLRRTATLLVYLGVLVCGVGIVWFIVAYPNFRAQASPIVTVYGLGILAMAAGGVFVPLTTTKQQAERDTLRTEMTALRTTMAEVEADEAELSELLETYKAALEDTEADEADLATVISTYRAALADADAEQEALTLTADRLRSDLADTEADEADLSAQLRALRSSQARFELYQDKGGKYRWRLRHRNGNVIADSAQGYSSKQKAQQGLHSVQRNALGAGIFHFEAEADDIDADVVTDAADVDAEAETPVQVVESRADFELYEDNGGKWRWRLRHDNGNIIADSGEGYSSKQKARQGMASVRNNVQQADYLRVDPTAFEIYRDKAGKYRWRLVHKNGQNIANGGQSYQTRRGARKGIDSVMNNVGDAAVEEGER
jgi:uncharacterized protein YegP (UPF0339 family)